MLFCQTTPSIIPVFDATVKPVDKNRRILPVEELQKDRNPLLIHTKRGYYTIFVSKSLL